MASVRRDAISIFNIICVLGMLIFNAISGMEPILKEQWQEILYVIPRVFLTFIFEAFIFLRYLLCKPIDYSYFALCDIFADLLRRFLFYG